MKRLWMLALLLWSAVALALPTVEQVQAEVKAGHYAQAEAMVREVVEARPGSARAHYVYAELLAHDGRLELAVQHAQQARTLDPAIRFTDPAKFRAFEQKLQAAQSAPSARAARSAQAVATAPAAQALPAPPSTNDSGIPGWVWPIGAMLLVVLLWRALVRPRVASGPGVSLGVPQGGGYRAGGYPGAGPGAYGGGYGGSRGSGLVGTGLAAAGGVAAGMLIEKMLEGGHHHDAPHPGGLQPGMFDDGGNGFGSDAIDFGGGGGDWGGDGGGDFGGDTGGSGGDW